MTTVESATSDQTWGRWIIRRLAWWWKQVRMLYQVLVLVRFSLLLGVVCALVMLLNDQAQDVLRLLGRGCRLASRLVSSRRGVERRRRLVVGAGDVLFPLPQSGIRAARLPPSQGNSCRARSGQPAAPIPSSTPPKPPGRFPSADPAGTVPELSASTPAWAATPPMRRTTRQRRRRLRLQLRAQRPLARIAVQQLEHRGLPIVPAAPALYASHQTCLSHGLSCPLASM